MIQSKMREIELFDSWSRVLKSGAYSEGGYVCQFEDLITHIYGQHAIAFNSAGTALYSVIRCLGSKRVIVPNNTFFATGGMAKEAGCEVTLADCSALDFSLDLASILDVYDGQDTIILTHIGGGMALEYEAIANWAVLNGVMLVEDAAHAFGVTKPWLPGQLSKAAVFSFYPTKAIPVGEGGVVVTGDDKLATELSTFRNYGKTKVKGKIEYSGSGFNFRMDEWTAAVGVSQVKRIREILELREEDAAKLRQNFPELVSWEQTNWYKYIVSSDVKAKQQTGKVYGLSDQMRSIHGFETEQPMPRSDYVADAHICLPVGEAMYAGKSADEVASWIMGE